MGPGSGDKMNQADLNSLLDSHELTWIEPADPESIPGGNRLELDNADLSGLDLSSRDLRACRLANCNLQNCNFSGSDISHSEFMGSDLRGANMSVTADSGTDFAGCTR